MVEFFGSRAVIGGKPAIIGTLVDITEIMRLNRLLKVLNSINKLIVHERNKKSLLEKACKELSNLEGYSAVTICLVEDKKITPVSSSGNSDVLEVHKNCTLINEVAKCKISVTRSLDECRNCPLYEEMKDNSKWVLSTPMFADGEVKGILTIYFVSDITKEEEELLRTMANDLAFAMRAIELDELKRKAYEQIEHNIEQYAILIDHIRNPLAAIIGIAEMEMKNETAAKIIEQARRIEEVLVRLDKGWLKSEQIRKFLREYP
jgi:two-component system response regulator